MRWSASASEAAQAQSPELRRAAACPFSKGNRTLLRKQSGTTLRGAPPQGAAFLVASCELNRPAMLP